MSSGSRCQVDLEEPVRSQARGAVLLRLAGDVDESVDPRLRNVLAEALSRRIARITVDLAHVTLVDATVLRTLLTFRRRCAVANTHFVLRGPGQAVERLLAASRLDRVFDVEPAM
jgi:anti-anti-sigma factor